MDNPNPDQDNDDINPNWFLVGLLIAFTVASLLCYLEGESFRSSFESDPVPRTGKEMRLVFLKVLLACCITRAVSIGIEIPLWMYGSCPTSWGCTLVHTAPNLPFLTAYSLLALFWAQLAMSITNQHQATLAPFFKKWNVALYGTFLLLAVCATVGALHRSIFIKAVVMLFGFYYLTALIVLVYFGFATFFAFKEETPKRNSPGGSPMITYRPVAVITPTQDGSSSSVISPGRTQNKSPVQPPPTGGGGSLTGTSTPPLVAGDILLSEKRIKTLRRLMCLCLFCGFLLLANTIFFLGSFLNITNSFRTLHRSEMVVAYGYLFLELVPCLLIMIILGSWKQRKHAGISLTIPLSIQHNHHGSHYGGMSRDSSYNDLKTNGRNTTRGERGAGGGGMTAGGVSRAGQRLSSGENPGNGLGLGTLRGVSNNGGMNGGNGNSVSWQQQQQQRSHMNNARLHAQNPALSNIVSNSNASNQIAPPQLIQPVARRGLNQGDVNGGVPAFNPSHV